MRRPSWPSLTGAALTDTGTATVAGNFQLATGGSASVTGDLGITGNGVVWLDAPFINGGGGSSLTISGTLTNSSTNSNALYIGNTSIGAGDTVTAAALVNTGAIQIAGNGAIQSTLDITTGAAGFGTLGVETGSVGLHRRCAAGVRQRPDRHDRWRGRAQRRQRADRRRRHAGNQQRADRPQHGRRLIGAVGRCVGHHRGRPEPSPATAWCGSTPRSTTAAAAAA